MCIEIPCVYCGAAIDPRSGDGDHVIPRAMGEFRNYGSRNDTNFRGICVGCNNAIGVSEQQLVRCGPERLYLELIFPGTRGGWAGAAGARGPTLTAQMPEGPVIARVIDVSKATTDEQLVFEDSIGKVHCVRLSPDMTLESVRKKVRGFEVKGGRAHIHAAECNLNRYLTLVSQVWPTSTAKGGSKMAQGVHRDLPLTYTLTVTDRYFRALAKIAFHYYLLQTRRFIGDEPEFQRIRQFIMNGGNKDEFMNAAPRLGVPDNMASRNWCHLLGASETSTRATGYVHLFFGPCGAAEEYHVLLGEYTPKPALSDVEFMWAHTYLYDVPVPETGKVGEVRPMLFSPRWRRP